ncbi:MgtC/SapB family protein [Paenibacillus flagellatus]|uniref:Magnesium transporter MgtC n=1 Tax=Paenibacillus flagellatus TaxID=2211139 RepID=A0A2V5KCN2_9BACL|nr:MgtC/SapB family protein [Paenibacillus flagellatus]PYI57288.1 magnesium transporter MgtC [Paenibacillus flagellatus]
MDTIDHHIWTITHGELIARLMLSAVLGGLIGIEREWSNHAAGFRTHILVCLGSTTIMLLSVYGFSEFVDEPNVRVDPARLAAQVISGIGFLGAGAIMRNGNVIKGLTTAASVWVVAAIGLCVGAGFFTGALISTLLVLVSLFLLNKLEKRHIKDRRNRELELEMVDQAGTLGQIASLLGDHDVRIVHIKIVPGSSADHPPSVVVQLTVQVKRQQKFMEAIGRISACPNILSLTSGSLPAASSAG